MRSGGIQVVAVTLAPMPTRVAFRGALPLLIVALAAALAAGCGGSSKPSASPPSAGTTTSNQTATTTGSGAPSALQAEAKSAATGDIPDNQVFLTFHNTKVGWSMKYPEGWTQSGSGSTLSFHDKNNIVRVVTSSASAPTPAA